MVERLIETPIVNKPLVTVEPVDPRAFPEEIRSPHPAQRRAAVDRCSIMVARLNDQLGGGWTGKVHYNCAWYYSASKGALSVYEQVDRSGGGSSGPRFYYSTLFGYDHAGRPEFSMRDEGRFDDPVTAVRAQVNQARGYLAEIEGLLTEVAEVPAGEGEGRRSYLVTFHRYVHAPPAVEPE